MFSKNEKMLKTKWSLLIIYIIMAIDKMVGENPGNLYHQILCADRDLNWNLPEFRLNPAASSSMLLT